MSDKEKEEAYTKINEAIIFCKKELNDTTKTPADLEDMQKKLADFLMRKGYLSMNLKKNYVDSMNEFTESLRLNPTSYCFSQRGFLFASLGFFSVGMADFEKGLELAITKKDIEIAHACIDKFKPFLK